MVANAVPAFLGRLQQPVHLGLGKEVPGALVAIGSLETTVGRHTLYLSPFGKGPRRLRERSWPWTKSVTVWKQQPAGTPTLVAPHRPEPALGRGNRSVAPASASRELRRGRCALSYARRNSVHFGCKSSIR